jgi:Phage tail tube protein
MAFQSITSAWRALSCLTQVAIGTAQPVTDLLTLAGTELMEPEPNTFFENKDEITGQLVSTKHQLLNMKFAGKHKAKATPTSVALFASMAMGSDTQTLIGATTAYSHLLQMNKAIVEVPYRTLVENDGTSQFGYTGVGCTGFTISASRGQFVEFEADLIGRASEGVDATAEPTANAESYLTYGNVDFLQGGTYDGTLVTGAASIAAQLVNFKLSYKNGAKGVYNVGDSTLNIGSIRRGLMATIELDAEIELVDRSQRTALLAGTELVMHIPIVGGVANSTAHYGIDIVLPRVVFKGAKKAAKEGVLSVAGKFSVLADPAHGALDIRVTNLYTHSYMATA